MANWHYFQFSEEGRISSSYLGIIVFFIVIYHAPASALEQTQDASPEDMKKGIPTLDESLPLPE